MKVFADYIVRLPVGMRDPAINLPQSGRARHKRQKLWLLIARLAIQLCPVNRPAVQPRWRARFQSAKANTKIADVIGQP